VMGPPSIVLPTTPWASACMGSVHVRQFWGQLAVATPDMIGEGALVKRPMEVNPLLCPLLAGQGVFEPAPGLSWPKTPSV